MLPPADLYDAGVAARPVPVALRQLCEQLVLLPLCAHDGGCKDLAVLVALECVRKEGKGRGEGARTDRGIVTMQQQQQL